MCPQHNPSDKHKAVDGINHYDNVDDEDEELDERDRGQKNSERETKSKYDIKVLSTFSTIPKES